MVSREKHIANDFAIDIGTTNTLISQEQFNANRINISITNTSGAGQVIALGFGQEAVLGRGIILNDGDTYVTSADAGYLPPQGRIHGIASANGSIAIHEEIILD